MIISVEVHILLVCYLDVMLTVFTWWLVYQQLGW